MPPSLSPSSWSHSQRNSAATTTPSVQAQVNVIHSAKSATSPSHPYPSPPCGEKIQLDWSPMPKQSFVIANLQVNSYLCYIHLLRALSAEVIVTVCDYVHCITPNTPDAYSILIFKLQYQYLVNAIYFCAAYLRQRGWRWWTKLSSICLSWPRPMASYPPLLQSLSMQQFPPHLNHHRLQLTQHLLQKATESLTFSSPSLHPPPGCSYQFNCCLSVVRCLFLPLQLRWQLM